VITTAHESSKVVVVSGQFAPGVVSCQALIKLTTVVSGPVNLKYFSPGKHCVFPNDQGFCVSIGLRLIDILTSLMIDPVAKCTPGKNVTVLLINQGGILASAKFGKLAHHTYVSEKVDAQHIQNTTLPSCTVVTVSGLSLIHHEQELDSLVVIPSLDQP
jgi:hypothetical protein